jgi:hypothetical protein
MSSRASRAGTSSVRIRPIAVELLAMAEERLTTSVPRIASTTVSTISILASSASISGATEILKVFAIKN